MSMQNHSSNGRRVAVIGGGAAGLLAAGIAGECGADVTLFEKQGKVGRKLAITGKGRCNLTNDCTREEFLESVVRNPRFLYAAIAAFSPQDTMAFFEGLGVKLKTERGRRVFPESDSAHDIVDALRGFAAKGAQIKFERVRGILVSDGVVTGVLGNQEYPFDAVILASGGLSYPKTGSDGDGHRFAQKLGHTVTSLAPSLVPIECKGGLCKELQGLSLRNVSLKIVNNDNEKVIYSDFGEMLFTHFGITGPMVLSASSRMHDIAPDRCSAVIDLKPALDEKTLDARLLSDFEKYKNKDFVNSLSDLLPAKIILPIIKLAGIDPRVKVNSLSKEQRFALLSNIKSLRIKLSRFRPIDEAIITSGGVEVKEIDPKTMRSKLVEGLYFAGEIMDVDAYTGGYNLQIAFSTAVAAGRAAANGK